MFNSKISGLGMYVPENVVTNHDLSKIMDTSNDWIVERTGIKERRHIKKGDGNSTMMMGVKAAKIAIERAGIDKNDIEKRYNSFKDKENNFENPAEEKANSEEISWLRFVLDNIKN